MSNDATTYTVKLTRDQIRRIHGALEYQRLTTHNQQDADFVQLIQRILTNSQMVSRVEA